MKNPPDVIEEIETSALAIELRYGKESPQMQEAALVINSCRYTLSLREALSLLDCIIVRGTMWPELRLAT